MNSNATSEGIRFIIPFEKKNKKNEKKGLTKSPFSAILNVSKERGIKKWNVLIVIESAEHTLNALNAERGNKNEIHRRTNQIHH